jgi:hypothetical protein
MATASCTRTDCPNRAPLAGRLVSTERRSAQRQLWSVDHGGVTWLIEADFTASRESDLGDRPPPRVLDVGARDTLRSQPLHLGVEITAHEVQLRPVRLGGMDRDLGRRQAEDQPTFARISEIEAKHLAEKSAIGVGIAAVQDDVCTEDHARILPALSGRRPEAREPLNATARIGRYALPTLMPVAPAEKNGGRLVDALDVGRRRLPPVAVTFVQGASPGRSKTASSWRPGPDQAATPSIAPTTT